MDQRVDVTISIVNWNTRDELRECLTSVLQQDGSVSFEVIVVDNASTDYSAEMVESEFAGRVILIRNDKNAGFGAGHNAAIRKSTGRYVFLLNPDSRLLDTQMLRKMVEYTDANPKTGMLGPKVLNPDGTLQFSARRFPTMFAGLLRHPAMQRFFPKNKFVRDYMMIDWSHDEVQEVDWLSGCALMVRRETFEKIGLLDEQFFMYCEDVDWCRRAHEGGWNVIYFPVASVSHQIGAASDKNPIPMIKQHHRSMLRYFLKYDGHGPKIVLLPLVLLALWVRARTLINRAKP